MRLINVEALLDLATQKIKVLKRFNDEELRGIRYATLSHCWCATGLAGELQFKELDKFTPETVQGFRNSPGYQKIVKTCSLARERGLEWLWVDTACIIRENESELSEAVNSMYQWYRNSEICFAYLHDVKFSLPTEPNIGMFPTPKGWPTWFSCSWTLQELLAPRHIHFFDQDWRLIGDKAELAHTLTRITGIPVNVLTNGLPHLDDPCRPSAAQIMSWAADRKTFPREDRAYALMGIFEVHMPTNYGEHEKAFHRLQVSIIKEYNDHSIFAWSGRSRPGSVLADDPSYFQGSADVVRLDPYDAFIRECPRAKQYIEDHEFFKVTEKSVEIWLPITFGHDSEVQPCVQVKLACCSESQNGELVTLNLVPVLPDVIYAREFGNFSALYEDPTFERIHLALDDNSYAENRGKLSHSVNVAEYGSLLPSLDKLSPLNISKESPSASTWPQVFRSWCNKVMRNVSNHTPSSSSPCGSSMQPPSELHHFPLHLSTQLNGAHLSDSIYRAGKFDPPSAVPHPDFPVPAMNVDQAGYTSTHSTVSYLNPSGDVPGVHARCGWRKNGMACGMAITYDCVEHLATVHGITKMAAKKIVICCWCQPPKEMRWDSILRHVREVHVGVKRRCKGKDNVDT